MIQSLSTRFARSVSAARPTLGWILAVTSAVLLPMGNAEAADGGWVHFLDQAHPFATAAYTYDSNLFRLDSDLPDARSDRYASLSAGFMSKLQVSQQRFDLKGSISRNIYDVNDRLDHTDGKGLALWNWKAARSLTGTFGYQYERSLRDFSNQLTIARIKDIRTKHDFLGSLELDLSGNWLLRGRGDYAGITFSNSTGLDLNRTTGGATLIYVSRSRNLLGLDAQIVKGDYTHNPLADFRQYTVGPMLEWQLSARAAVIAKAGYTKRNFTNAARNDYGGPTGRISLKVEGNGNRTTTISIWHELSNLNDEIADFTVVDGISFEPSWQLTSQVGMRLKGSYEDRRFKTVTAGGAGRQDDVFAAGAFADWAVNRVIKVSLGVDAEKRASTRDLQDYDFKRIQLQITGSF